MRAVAVAGGGTGGHLFPGMALAEEFRRRDEKIRILYIGVKGKLEERLVPAAKMQFHGLKMTGLKGMGVGRKIAGLVKAAWALLDCRRALKVFRPDLLIGVGGYSSGPAAVAAWTLGIPVVLQEQNTVPGLTNRLLGRIARVVFLAFEEGADFFPAGKGVVTGNPIREGALADLRDGGGNGPLKVLVLGGSRGAGGVNEMVSASLRLLVEERGRVSFVHQSGAEDRDRIAEEYRRRGFEAETTAFIDDMKARYEWADVVISRAGAGAVSELAANGLAAVLIPFPRAAGDHQKKNAQWLVRRGGAVMIEEASADGAAELARALSGFSRDRKELRRMAEASGNAGRRDAAGKIVAGCYELVNAQREVKAWPTSK